MYALDVDPIEIVKTKERLKERGFGEEILTIKQMNFADIDRLVPEAGLFDFDLASRCLLDADRQPGARFHL